MKRSFLVVVLCSVLFMLQSCSWQEYFIISNQSNQHKKIAITITNVQDGFPIFEKNPDFYESDNSGEPIWDKKKSLQINKVSDLTCEFDLPPGHCVVFGHLSNDKYESYDQNFINGRKFNLSSIEVEDGVSTRLITPVNFDKHFKKSNGNITMVIKQNLH